MENELTYDSALAKADAIVKELEQAQALSMDMYQAKAAEAAKYLDICRKEIGKIEQAYSSEK